MIRRQPPRFPPAIWNVHDATMQGEARTNNACEAWNNGFKHLVGHSNPKCCGQLSPASRKIIPSWKLTSSATHVESPSPDECIILMSHIRYSEINHLKINYFQLLYII